MELDEYQEKAQKYDVGKPGGGVSSPAFMQNILGLSGEAGEVADKIKKILRDQEGELSDEAREGVIKELGDVLWYVANVARYLEAPLSEVARGNLEKLESRYQRGKLGGSGDNR